MAQVAQHGRLQEEEFAYANASDGDSDMEEGALYHSWGGDG